MNNSVRLVLGIAAVTAAGVMSCGKTVTVPGGTSTTSALQPVGEAHAAKGELKIKEGDNGNTALGVNVKYLAPPEKMAPNATTYVVWAKPRVGDMRPQNLGALHVNDDREGSLDTVTSLKNFDVIETPEPSAAVTAPTHSPVFTGVVQR
jgi:hypothetical protein